MSTSLDFPKATLSRSRSSKAATEATVSCRSATQGPRALIAWTPESHVRATPNEPDWTPAGLCRSETSRLMPVMLPAALGSGVTDRQKGNECQSATQPAQQESFATSLSKACAASLNPSTVVK